MPDEALLARAAQGRLRAPGALDGEVRRMLRDPKSRALVDGFGAEWLQAQKFVAIAPNRQIYQDWDDELEAAVKPEPLAFFEEVLRDDLSALNFLTPTSPCSTRASRGTTASPAWRARTFAR